MEHHDGLSLLLGTDAFRVTEGRTDSQGHEVPLIADPDKITFRIKGVHGKLSKMYEDRITVTIIPGGYEFEGLRKDVLRLAAGFETSFYNYTEV